MKLQPRDIDIINYIKDNGATIEQIAKMYFFDSSYDAARKRLKKLENEKFINSKIHPVLGKKVFYKRRLPSYHTLVIQDVYLLNRDIIQSFKREAELDKHRVDALIVTKNQKVVILEVDIFNRTSKEKIESINKYIKLKLGIKPVFMILDRLDINNQDKKKIRA